MTSKYLFIAAIILIGFAASCGSDDQKPAENLNAKLKEPGDNTGVAVAVDDSKGKGKFTEVKLTHPLDAKMVEVGKTLHGVKCIACHKLTEEKLVGPGWKGVTDRRKPEWIMNFITNTDEMIEKDPAAQQLLAKCIVRMPNLNLTDEEARKVLEFMRSNDGKN